MHVHTHQSMALILCKLGINSSWNGDSQDKLTIEFEQCHHSLTSHSHEPCLNCASLSSYYVPITLGTLSKPFWSISAQTKTVPFLVTFS